MRLLFVAFIIVVLNRCITPFNPETTKYEKILVVDALLTNDQDEYPRVTLTESFQTDGIKPTIVSGATVRVLLEDDAVLEFQEISNGSGIYKYYGDKSHFIVGSTFKLQIEYDGETFESTNETMLPVATITSVDYEQANESDDSYVDIFISTNGNTEESSYYSWNYVETWEVGVEYYFDKYRNNQRCFPSEKREVLLVGTTEQNASNMLNKHPLYRVSLSSGMFQEQYSTEIKQYSISRDTYVYLQHLIDQKELVGSLFDPLPSTMYGNITCTSNKEVPVLGNFQVSAVTSSRLFINKHDFDYTFTKPYALEDCDLVYIFHDQYEIISKLIKEGYSIADTAYNLDGSPRSLAMSSYVRCYNCYTVESPNTVPEWWIEK